MLQACYTQNVTEAGVDEAGRGCLAGPVFAGAVILLPDYFHPLLNDSKQLNEKQRNVLRVDIEQNALSWAVAYCTHIEIDEMNILKASHLAMHRAIKKLHLEPQFLLIDGNRFNPYPKIKHQCFVKGDGMYASIAAASILAKTHRDEFMLDLHQQFPYYGWDKNKSYGTKQHINAIAQYGLCEYHRKTFKLKSNGAIIELNHNIA